MATYVISDIHGRYDKFTEMLDIIDLKDDDTLYILGDVLDRGPEPIKVILKIMEMPNVIMLRGNHEEMAMKCLPTLVEELTESMISSLNDIFINDFMIWTTNGNQPTLDGFYVLDKDTKNKVLEYIGSTILYKSLTVGGNEYLLVHAGLGNFSPDKLMEEYTVNELVWDRADYEKQYFDDKFLVTGHTPTQTIDCCENPGYIYRSKNHIAIDCGACFKTGRLAAICLDTGEEFYTSETE